MLQQHQHALHYLIYLVFFILSNLYLQFLRLVLNKSIASLKLLAPLSQVGLLQCNLKFLVITLWDAQQVLTLPCTGQQESSWDFDLLAFCCLSQQNDSIIKFDFLVFDSNYYPLCYYLAMLLPCEHLNHLNCSFSQPKQPHHLVLLFNCLK